jgi:acyl-CoA reductase-like NAD-dependent aldehyde dehydrogenase
MSEIAKHWIDGEWTGSGTVSESVNPATGAVLGRWADGGEAEARAAIAAARRAFDTSPWSRDRSLRHRVLNEMADRFDAHAEELGTLVTKENGKKIAEGLFEGTSPSPALRHNAAQALTDTGISAEVAPGQWFSTYAEPTGVIGIIVPWNSPVALLIRSLAPALSAGNTVAVKMPGQTALVANLVSQIIAEVTSLPRGVVNIFTESGNTGAPYPGRLTRRPGHQLHRQHHSRTPGRRQRRSHPQADEPRARRQDADDRVRRRRPGHHRSAARGGDHDLRRGVLHDGLADPGAAGWQMRSARA